MTGTLTTPGLMLSGGGFGGGNAADDPNALAQIYQNLLSGAADIVQGLNDKVLIIGSGPIGSAGSIQAQVGNETWQELDNNIALLGSIAAFCKANGIVVEVPAVLTDSATYSDGTNALVDQWASAAAAVGLPIVGVEDVQEIGISQAATTFANFANTEVNAVRTLIENYATSSYKMAASDLTVGDMEGGGTIAVVSEWWNAYNAAANSGTVSVYEVSEQIVSNGVTSQATIYTTDKFTVGQTITTVSGTITVEAIQDSISQVGTAFPKFSFVTEDMGWDAPWIAPESTPSWEGYAEALSTLAASDKMSFDIDMQGQGIDTSNSEFVRQVEENAATLAVLQGEGSVNVANLKMETWGQLTEGVNPINSPTSTSNLAAEVDATYPLFEAGSITVQGTIITSALAQAIVTTGSATSIDPLAVQWDTADVQAGRRLGVVIIDQTGTLSATQHGAGTVSDPAANILVLSGNSADLAAELSSIKLTEGYSGPDMLDVETFGTAGQLSDNQISVLALQSGQSPSEINATSNLQGWVSSSAFLNGGSVMTSETLDWNTTGTLAGTISGTTAGQSAFVKVDAVHEPLAEYGVENVATYDGVAINAVVDVNNSSVDNAGDIEVQGGAANNIGQDITVGLTGWLPGVFDPAAVVTMVTVQATTNTFNSVTGQLLSSVDTLAPDALTVVNLQGTAVANIYATQFNTGGTQIVEYNTGNNPAWQVGWGSQFSSATLTYDGAGQPVEEFLQGRSSDSSFTIDDVFDPSNGHLWEQFQSAEPPPGSSYSNPVAGFVTGPLYVTQFNTGDNPNWDYVDWRQAATDTEVWTDYFIMQDMFGFFVSNDFYSYNYEFVNGSTLDLLNLPGINDVNLNALGTAIIDSQTTTTALSGLTAIDAAGATGTITLTGLAAGGSTLIGGNTNSTLIGYGGDTIIAGNGTSTINTGNGSSTILLSGTAGTATIIGNDNVVTVGTVGNSVTLTGNGNTVTAVARITVTESAANTSLTVDGNSVTTTGAAGDTITATGTADIINLVNGGTLVQGSASSSATVNGNGVTVWMNGAGGTITAVGNDDVVTGGSHAVVNLVGNSDTTGTSPGAIISTSGQFDIVYGSTITITEAAGGSNLLVFGSIVTVNAATGDSLTVYGTGEEVNGSGVTVTTGYNTTSVTVSGSNVAVSMNAAGGTVTATGNDVAVSGSSAAIVTLDGTDDTANLVNSSTVTVIGNAGTVSIGSNGSIDLSGNQDVGTVSSNTTAAWEWGTDDTLTAGNTINAWMVGNSDTLIAGNAATIDLAGSLAVANLGSAATTWENGFGAQDAVQANGIIDQYGTDEIGVGGTYTSGWQQGVGSQLTAGNYSSDAEVANSDTASLGNYSTLTANGTLNVATLLADGTITINGQSDSVVAGASATATITGNSDTLSVGSNSTVAIANNAAAAVVDVTTGTVTLGNNASATISGSGSIINSGTASSVSLAAQNTLTIAAGASLDAAITNTGTIDLTSGTLVFQQPVSNSATFLLGGTATLDFVSTVTSGAGIQFIHLGGTLEEQAAGLFGPQVTGFAAGDIIDATAVLYGLAPTLHFNAGTLSVTDGTHTDSFALVGTYVASDFQLASDGHNGTAISHT